jgi:hypothetical protein
VVEDSVSALGGMVSFADSLSCAGLVGKRKRISPGQYMSWSAHPRGI